MTRSPRGTAGAVRREELYCREAFGERYAAYRRRTPALVPLGWLVPRKRESPESGQVE